MTIISIGAAYKSTWTCSVTSSEFLRSHVLSLENTGLDRPLGITMNDSKSKRLIVVGDVHGCLDEMTVN